MSIGNRVNIGMYVQVSVVDIAFILHGRIAYEYPRLYVCIHMHVGVDYIILNYF